MVGAYPVALRASVVDKQKRFGGFRGEQIQDAGRGRDWEGSQG